MNITFNICDDDGLLGIVNNELYDAFIGEDWEFDEVKERIIQESNKEHLLFWGTGCENFWPVNVSDSPISLTDFRSFSGFIRVTNGDLYLISYTDLTMAAQFEDQTLPSNTGGVSRIELENDLYEVMVRQLVDPSNVEEDAATLGFELIVRAIPPVDKEILNNFDSITWLHA